MSDIKEHISDIKNQLHHFQNFMSPVWFAYSVETFIILWKVMSLENLWLLTLKYLFLLTCAS